MNLIRWLITTRDKKAGWFLSLDNKQSIKLRVYSKCVLSSSVTLGYARWAGGNRLFTRPEYKKLMDTFFKFDWVQWKRLGHPKSGVILTDAGKEAFYKLAGYEWAPPLKSYDVGGLRGFEHTYIDRK